MERLTGDSEVKAVSVVDPHLVEVSSEWARFLLDHHAIYEGEEGQREFFLRFPNESRTVVLAFVTTNRVLSSLGWSQY